MKWEYANLDFSNTANEVNGKWLWKTTVTLHCQGIVLAKWSKQFLGDAKPGVGESATRLEPDPNNSGGWATSVLDPLSFLGSLGWELVAIYHDVRALSTGTTTYPGWDTSMSIPMSTVAFFKRTAEG